MQFDFDLLPNYQFKLKILFEVRKCGAAILNFEFLDICRYFKNIQIQIIFITKLQTLRLTPQVCQCILNIKHATEPLKQTKKLFLPFPTHLICLMHFTFRTFDKFNVAFNNH